MAFRSFSIVPPASDANNQLLNSTLSSLDVNVAILDQDGTILQVNDCWTEFASANGAEPSTIAQGINYLDVCRRSTRTCSDAAVALDGILAVLSGAQSYFIHTYSCHSSEERRWYVMRVSPARVGDAALIVTHQRAHATIESGIRYSEILDSVRAIIWTADAPTFRTTYASLQTKGILGYPAAVFTEDPYFWKNHIHPDDSGWVLETVSAAIPDGKTLSFEHRMIAADGQIVWLRNIVNVIAGNGQPPALVGVSTDITERKRAESALEATQDRYRKIFEYAPTGIALSDLNGRFVQSNQAYRDCVGYTEDELHDLEFSTLVHPDDRADNLVEVQRVINGEVPYFHIENRYIRKTGETVWVRKFGSLFTDANGAPAYLLALVTDVTEWRRVMEDLQTSEERFRATFEQAAVGIAHVAMDGTFLRLNRRYCEIAGYEHDALLKLKFQDITHPDDLSSDLSQAERLVGGDIQTYTMEKRYIRKDDSIVWVSLTRSIVSENGRPPYFIAVVQDITSRKLVEAALSEQRGRVLNAQEDERKRIARELHDGVGQELLIANLNLSKLANTTDANTAIKQELITIADKIEHVSLEIRQISHHLHPATLQHLGINQH